MNYGNQAEIENTGADGGVAQAFQTNQPALQNQLGNNDLSLAVNAANNPAQQLPAKQVGELGVNTLGAGGQEVNRQFNDGGANTFSVQQQQ